jgi:hypothetical protein
MKGCIAVITAVAAAVFAPAALAGNDHRTLGPAGYDTPGKSALVLAGTSGVELGSGDHVVICHAIGGANGDRFNQIAPSASGVLHGHDGHEGDRDIIPPYTYVDHKGNKDASLVAGNNWSGANIALYNNGCAERELSENPPEQPRDECPNIAGNQQTIPAGLVKDGSGNCVAPPAQQVDVCPNIEGLQTAIPAGFVKDAAGNCICPPVTVTVNTVAQTVPQVVAQTTPLAASAPVTTSVVERATVKTSPKAKNKVKKKAKKKAKAKAKRKVKRAKRKVKALPRVLPFTP